MARVCDICACRWRLLDRKNMTLDRAHEPSTGWAEIPLLPQNLWHNPQTVTFSGHMPTSLECSDHRMGVPSSSTPRFQFASSSLSSALSPSVSSSNPSPMHLQPGGATSYLITNCGSPVINPGNSPMDIDYENVIQDRHPADPDRGTTPTAIDVQINSVGAQPPVGFSVSPNSPDELPPANVSIPDNTHPHPNIPNIEVDVPCVTPTLPISVPPMSPAHDVAIAHHGPVHSIPETLVLEEATTPVPSSGPEPAISAKTKRGRNGTNYKLSSSLPVTLE